MSAVANEVTDLLVKRAEQAEAVNAIYDEIHAWCLNQKKWYVRLGNWLLRRHPIHPMLPMRPLYWRVLVMIRRPDESYGDSLDKGKKIILVKDSLDAEVYLTYVGMVVAFGRLAFKATTRAGLKLSKEKNPKLGEIVVFYKNAGTRFMTTDGHMFVLLSETELWAETKTPERLDTMAL